MEDKKIKILIVDDDDSTRNLYADVFRNNNFEVVEAIDGLDGLDRAVKERPDIVFTGIIMPRMDGFGLIEELKKNVATSGILVVISSHMGREVDREKASQLGAKDFIARDLNTPNEVVKKILAIFNFTEYKLKFDIQGLDAPKIAEDFRLSHGFSCRYCEGESVLALKVSSASEREFAAKFVCLRCKKSII